MTRYRLLLEHDEISALVDAFIFNAPYLNSPYLCDDGWRLHDRLCERGLIERCNGWDQISDIGRQLLEALGYVGDTPRSMN